MDDFRNLMVKRRRNRVHQQLRSWLRHRRRRRRQLWMLRRVMKVKRKIVMEVDHRFRLLYRNRLHQEQKRKRVKNQRKNERRKQHLVIHRFVQHIIESLSLHVLFLDGK